MSLLLFYCFQCRKIFFYKTFVEITNIKLNIASVWSNTVYE